MIQLEERMLTFSFTFSYTCEKMMNIEEIAKPKKWKFARYDIRPERTDC